MHERLDDEQQRYGPACYVCHGRIDRDARGGTWQHVRRVRRAHDVVYRASLPTGRVRVVCSCGWRGEWRRTDPDMLELEWSDHATDTATRPVIPM